MSPVLNLQEMVGNSILRYLILFVLFITIVVLVETKVPYMHGSDVFVAGVLMYIISLLSVFLIQKKLRLLSFVLNLVLFPLGFFASIALIDDFFLVETENRFIPFLHSLYFKPRYLVWGFFTIFNFTWLLGSEQVLYQLAGQIPKET